MVNFISKLATATLLVAFPLVIRRLWGFEVAVLVTLGVIWNVMPTPHDIREILAKRKDEQE